MVFDADEFRRETHDATIAIQSFSRTCSQGKESSVLFNSKSMQHGQRVWSANQTRVKFEIEIEAAIRFGVVNGPRHQEVSRVMVAFRFDEAGVELRQRAVDWPEFAGENLKFFATAPFDERAANQVVDDLVPLPVTDGFHQTGNPRTRMGLAERDAAACEQIQHELEMLQFLDGDSVEFCDARI